MQWISEQRAPLQSWEQRVALEPQPSPWIQHRQRSSPWESSHGECHHLHWAPSSDRWKCSRIPDSLGFGVGLLVVECLWCPGLACKNSIHWRLLRESKGFLASRHEQNSGKWSLLVGWDWWSLPQLRTGWSSWPGQGNWHDAQKKSVDESSCDQTDERTPRQYSWYEV